MRRGRLLSFDFVLLSWLDGRCFASDRPFKFVERQVALDESCLTWLPLPSLGHELWRWSLNFCVGLA